MCTKLIGLLLLVSFSLGLHYKMTIYNERTYLPSLAEIQNKYVQDLQRLRQRVSKAKTEALQSSNMGARIAIYQEALADQRDLLSRIQSYIAIPYSSKICECHNFSQLHKSQIMNSVLAEEAALRKFKEGVSQRQNCSNINELNREIIKEEQYIGIIKDIVNSDCRRLPRPFIEDRPLGMVDLKKYLYVSDLQTTKWIYGSLTESQYKYKTFALTSKSNLTKCPPSRPFAISTLECVSCTEQHPIWDLSTLQCTSCTPPEHYNPFGHNCTTKDIREDDSLKKYRVISMNSNPSAQNYIGRPMENNPVAGTCPSSTPFSDGSACVKCDLPRVWNYNKLKCEQCGEGKVFDKYQKECIIGGSFRSTTQTTTTLTTQTDTLPEGEFLTNLYARNILIGDDLDYKKIVDDQRQLRNSKGNSLPLCSADRPYFNGRKCISCYGQSPLFDLGKRECTDCSVGFTYFSNIHKCTRNIRVTNAQAPNLLQTPDYKLAKLYQGIEQLRNRNPNNKIENCQINVPYEKDNECIKCSKLLPLYNLETKRCDRCGEGRYYDPNDKQCQKYSRITSPQAPNLYFRDTTKQQYETEYREAKLSDPTIKDCPPDQPYFNGKRCISCSSENPLFSVYVKLCGKCPLRRSYSPQTGECNSDIPQSPSVPNSRVPVVERIPPPVISGGYQRPESNKGGAVFSIL